MAIIPSCGYAFILMKSFLLKAGFSSTAFSALAPRPKPFGLGLRTRGSLRAFYLLNPMPL
jgi:hypothetical protein